MEAMTSKAAFFLGWLLHTYSQKAKLKIKIKCAKIKVFFEIFKNSKFNQNLRKVLPHFSIHGFFK
jgi:hypothetical protein